MLIAIFAVTVLPIQLRPTTAEPAGVERILAFGLLGLIFVFAYPRHWILVTCLMLGTAFGFEAIQHLSPSRHAHLEDAIVKAIGGLAGVALGTVLNRIIDR